MHQGLQLFLWWIWFQLVAAVTAVWQILVFIATNLATALPVALVVILFIILFAVMLIYTEFFVILFYYIIEIVRFVVGIFVLVANGFALLWGWLVPILGIVAEGVIVAGIATWSTFCPSNDVFGCLHVGRLLTIIQDIFSIFGVIWMLLVTTIKAYAGIIYEFICRLAVYQPSLETYFCVEQVGWHRTSVRNSLTNATTVYLQDQAIADITLIFGVIGNILQYILGPLVDILGRLALFAVSFSLIVWKYAVLGSAILLSLVLTLLVGVIYTTHPFDVATDTGAPSATPDMAFDLYASRFTDDILAIDPVALFRTSDFPCPYTLCPVLENVLNQTEAVFDAVWEAVPDIFMFIDMTICTLKNLQSCGAEYKICEILYSKETGIIYSFIDEFKIFLPLILTPLAFALNIITAPAAILAMSIVIVSITTEELLWPLNQGCVDLLSRGTCQCFTCPTEVSNSIAAYLGLGPDKLTTCNLFAPVDELCCLGGSDFFVWTIGCELIETTGYKSLALDVYEVQYPERDFAAVSRTRPFRCVYLNGYVYQFMDKELEVHSDEYFEPPPGNLLIDGDQSRQYIDAPLLVPDITDFYVKVHESIPTHRDMTVEAMMRDRYDTRDGATVYTQMAYRQTLRSLTTGCTGPDYLSYYPYQPILSEFSPNGALGTPTVRKFMPTASTTMSVWHAMPQYDQLFEGYTFIHYYFSTIDPVVFGVGIFSPPVYAMDEVPIYCNAYLKAAERQHNGGYIWELGGMHHYTVAVSYARGLREQYLAAHLSTVAGLPYGTGYAARKTFLGLPNYIRPSILIDLVAKSRTVLLAAVGMPVSPTVAAAVVATPAIAYPGFPTETVCGFTTIDTWRDDYGYPPASVSETIEFAGYWTPTPIGPINYLFPDARRFSYHHYYLFDPRTPHEAGAPPFQWSEALWRGNASDPLVGEVFGCTQFTGRDPIANATFQLHFEQMMADRTIPVSDAVEYMFATHQRTRGYDGWVDAFGTDDDFEHAKDLFVVVQVMKERYFSTRFLLHALDLYLAGSPCDHLNDLNYTDVDYINGAVYTPVECATELEFHQTFLRHFARADGNGLFNKVTTTETYPDYLATRDAALHDILFNFELADFVLLVNTGHFSLPSRYRLLFNFGPVGVDLKPLARQLLYNFIYSFASMSQIARFNAIPYNHTDAIDFCASAEKTVPFGVGATTWRSLALPSTECVLLMTGLDTHPAFAATFFDGVTSDADIVTEYVANIYDYPGRDGTLDTTILGRYVDDTAVSLPTA